MPANIQYNNPLIDEINSCIENVDLTSEGFRLQLGEVSNTLAPANTSIASTSSGIQTFSTVTNLDNNACGINSSFLSYCPTTKVFGLDVKQILDGDIIGKAILKKYNVKSSLDTKDRNTICEILVTYFLNCSYKLNNESLSIIADKIVALFPASEKRATYFVSPIPKKKSGRNKPEISKGKLVDKHRNKLTALRRALESADCDKSENQEVVEGNNI